MLSILVPCYNEEAAIPLFLEEVEKISQMCIRDRQEAGATFLVQSPKDLGAILLQNS